MNFCLCVTRKYPFVPALPSIPGRVKVRSRFKTFGTGLENKGPIARELESSWTDGRTHKRMDSLA